MYRTDELIDASAGSQGVEEPCVLRTVGRVALAIYPLHPVEDFCGTWNHGEK